MKKEQRVPSQPRRPAHNPHGAIITLVREKFTEISELYVRGESLAGICERLDLGITGTQLRETIRRAEDLTEAFNAARQTRGHNMIERAVEWGMEAAQSGDLKTAIDTMFKAAAKTTPELYGDKQAVELTGKDGGALQVKADLTLTPAEAYARLAGGK